jgi:alanyl-tRNA synthetase
MLTSKQIVEKYISFFEQKGHKKIPGAPLVLQNDPTTLFTSSGMQPLVPYLLGEQHPDGKRLVNVQNCFRSQDITEVGDNRHTTFFRMLGNWSLGDYFKKDEIPWFWEFLTKELGLPSEKLFITVFSGIDDIPKDEEAVAIWNSVLEKEGLNPTEKISYYSDKSNWWSRAGTPDKMPVGEPGGPSTEIFYEFDTPHNPAFGKDCHPNCDCGRFMEIGNSVFMQYQKQEDGSLRELPNKNVDFGGGLERLAAAINNDPDVFKTDLYASIIKEIEASSDKKYAGEDTVHMRVIADHLKAAVFLIIDGVKPSNKEHGYLLRRLLRRAAVKMHFLKGGLTPIPAFQGITDQILHVEEDIPDSGINRADQRDLVFQVVGEEMDRFGKSLDKGLSEIEKAETIKGKEFYFFQTFGFPIELIEELAAQKGQEVDKEKFEKELKEHRDLSRTASAGKFKGGLMDHEEKTIMGHTATHLLHQALRDVLGNQVHQTGSNITTERLRFDFNYDKALTEEELEKVGKIINDKIKENLPVHFEMLTIKEADELGAIGLFRDTYGDKVKIYFIGKREGPYSVEFCGGPHVDFTASLKNVTIIKQENIGHGQRRIYAKVG